MQFDNSTNRLNTQEIIKIYIDEFNTSKQKKLMLKGEKYYKVENDILDRKMYRYQDETMVLDDTKTNNKLAHGFMHTLVDDKVNYLLTKAYALISEDEKHLDLAEKTLGNRFQKTLSRLGTEASNKGIAWLHAYIDSKGSFRTMKIPSEQVIPIWEDNDHEELQALIRYYDVEVYEGKEKAIVTKIEYWTPQDVAYYILQDNEVILDAEMYLDGDNDYDGHFKVNNMASNWDRVPFIPFKNNDYELPDLQFVKTLIDNYDLTRSDVANLLEDVKNFILALRGYGGDSLSEFMRDLSYYRAVKLDEDGGLEKIESAIDIVAAQTHYEALKKDIYDFGQGVDKNQDKLGNSPSGVALKFIYSGLDLKCNALEEWFKWSFNEVMYFVDLYLAVTNQGGSDKEINIVFNRDIAINEDAAIMNCQNSMGIISHETIISMHPWTEDVEKEIAQMNDEGLQQISDMFPKVVDDEDEEER